MKQLRYAVLGCLLFVLSLLGCSKKQQTEEPPPDKPRKTSGKLYLWEISSPQNTSYLLGSMHIGNKDLYPLPKEIEDAFAKSKVFVIEADFDSLDPVQMKQMVDAKGTYQDGTKLTDHLSKETADQLRSYYQRSKLPQEQLIRLKPWIVYSMISALEAQKLGYDIEQGLDKHFLKKARTAGKPIVELETLQSQMDLFSGLDDKLQDLLLLNTLMEVKDSKTTMKTIIEAWEDGDLAKMEKVALVDPLAKEPKIKPLYAKIFDERNVKMADKIEKHLKGKEPTFILVGAGHIPGEKGILKLLENKGFKIKQMERGK